MSQTPLYRNIETPTHGRSLIAPASSLSPAGTIMAFHGYAQSADWMLTMLRDIPQINHTWHLCALQGLHRFYQPKSGEIVASWMTSQDREWMIEDNVVYVGRTMVDFKSCIEQPGRHLIFLGFSQGAAMAWRAAARYLKSTRAVVAAGGDIPPDVHVGVFADWQGGILVARGRHDRIYSAPRLQNDTEKLEGLESKVELAEYNGSHELNADFGRILQRFLGSIEAEASDLQR